MYNTLNKDFISTLTNQAYEWKAPSPEAHAAYIERALTYFTGPDKKYLDIVILRFGLSGSSPQTFQQMAVTLGRYHSPEIPSNPGSIRQRYENAMIRHQGFLLRFCKDLIIERYHPTRAERISEGLRCSRKTNS